MQDGFTSRAIVALTGITPRQLQWWDERGVVKPDRQGHRRLYSFDQVTEVAVICQLRRKGFSLQGVRKVMRFLDRELGKGLADLLGRNSEYHLLTDGARLYLETSARQIIDILKNSRQPIPAVCLTDAVRQIRSEVFSRKSNTSVTTLNYRGHAKRAL
ncbi:MAG TPA: MerR family transcriptional regulator [Verrucomicrobiae bacterium]|nr:MerR family transcriptional regulator [Verrucomicrobiae bacterium]